MTPRRPDWRFAALFVLVNVAVVLLWDAHGNVLVIGGRAIVAAALTVVVARLAGVSPWRR